MSKKCVIAIVIIVLVSLLLVENGWGQPPYVSYQGHLIKNGSPYTGLAEFKASIVNGGTVLWSNDGTLFGEPGTPFPVDVDNGVFSFLLGDPAWHVPLTSIELMPAVEPVIRLWVDTGDGFEQLTDQPMASAPFAMRSESAQFAFGDFMVYGQLGVKTTEGPQTDFHVIGESRFQPGGGDFLFTTVSGTPALVTHAPNGNRRDVQVDHNGMHLLVGSDSGAPSSANGIHINELGNVGIGTDSPSRRLHVDGTVRTGVLEITGGADLSEGFDITGSGRIEPGMVVCIDPRNPGGLTIATEPYARTVAGIVSGAGGVQPGMVMGQSGSDADGPHPVALSGRVWTKAVVADGAAIEPGDLLTTSGLPGHAMKATDLVAAQGAILGKAMTSLEQGTGLVLVLVTLQ